MSDLVLARKPVTAAWLECFPEKPRTVSECSGLSGKAKSVKLEFERSNGLDTALYQNYLFYSHRATAGQAQSRERERVSDCDSLFVTVSVTQSDRQTESDSGDSCLYFTVVVQLVALALQSLAVTATYAHSPCAYARSLSVHSVTGKFSVISYT